MAGYECALTALKQCIEDLEIQKDWAALPKNVYLSNQTPPFKAAGYLYQITIPKI